MIRTIFSILVLAIGAIAAGFAVSVLAGYQPPLIDRLAAFGLLVGCAAVMFFAMASLVRGG
jgi:hypothetical protein